jgi:hypothetical protein
MARKRNETRSIISAGGGAAAAPVNRKRTTHVQPGPKTVDATAGSARSGSSHQPISEREEIAKLAYSFWQERGGHGGSPEQDWLRAEQEFLRRREACTS